LSGKGKNSHQVGRANRSREGQEKRGMGEKMKSENGRGAADGV